LGDWVCGDPKRLLISVGGFPLLHGSPPPQNLPLPPYQTSVFFGTFERGSPWGGCFLVFAFDALFWTTPIFPPFCQFPQIFFLMTTPLFPFFSSLTPNLPPFSSFFRFLLVRWGFFWEVTGPLFFPSPRVFFQPIVPQRVPWNWTINRFRGGVFFQTELGGGVAPGFFLFWKPDVPGVLFNGTTTGAPTFNNKFVLTRVGPQGFFRDLWTKRGEHPWSLLVPRFF